MPQTPEHLCTFVSNFMARSRGLRTEPAEGTDAMAAIGGADDMDTSIQRKRGAEEQGSQDLPADINDMHPDDI